MAVDYTEIGNSPTGSQNVLSGSWTGKRQLLCAWADRFDLLTEFLAWPGAVHPDNALARATQGNYKGAGKSVSSGDSKVKAWAFAEVMVEFSTPRPGDPIEVDGEMISEGITASAEFLSLDHTLFRWDGPEGADVKQAEAPSRMELGFDYTFTRYNTTGVPAATLGLIGFSNNANVEAPTLGLIFPTQTLCFLTIDVNRRTSGATSVVDYTMRFGYKGGEWNKFWRIGKTPTPGYSEMYLAGGGRYYNYPPVSFAGI